MITYAKLGDGVTELDLSNAHPLFKNFLKENEAYYAFAREVNNQCTGFEIEDPSDYLDSTIVWATSNLGGKFWGELNKKWKDVLAEDKILEQRRKDKKLFKMFLKSHGALQNWENAKRLEKLKDLIPTNYLGVGVHWSRTDVSDVDNFEYWQALHLKWVAFLGTI